jgi:hypothetical protein
MRSARLALVILCAFVVLGSGAAHAKTYVNNTCSALTNWSFSPALNLSSHTGTIYAGYSGTCFASSVDTVAPAVDQGIWPSTWDNSFPAQYAYSGTCALASMTYFGTWGSGILIGGSVVYASASNPYYDPSSRFYEVTVLVPLLLPCAETGAVGYSQGSFIGSY